jgi:hypothetical protein
MEIAKADRRYKRCGKHIVILKVTGNSNEGTAVFDGYRAKYSCNKAMVLDILNLYKTNADSDSAKCHIDPKIVYRKGKEITTKITYYRTFKAALFSTVLPPLFFTGEWLTFYDDGRIRTRGYYVRGIPSGIHCTRNRQGETIEFEERYHSGNLKRKGQYDDFGGRVGEWTTHDDNGKIVSISTYKKKIKTYDIKLTADQELTR